MTARGSASPRVRARSRCRLDPPCSERMERSPGSRRRCPEVVPFSPPGRRLSEGPTGPSTWASSPTTCPIGCRKPKPARRRVGRDPDRVAIGLQVHGSDVMRHTQPPARTGRSALRGLEPADGQATDHLELRRSCWRPTACPSRSRRRAPSPSSTAAGAASRPGSSTARWRRCASLRAESARRSAPRSGPASAPAVTRWVTRSATRFARAGTRERDRRRRARSAAGAAHRARRGRVSGRRRSRQRPLHELPPRSLLLTSPRRRRHGTPGRGGVARAVGALDRERVRANVAAVRERIAAACGRAGRDPGAVELLAATKYVPIDQMGVLARRRPRRSWARTSPPSSRPSMRAGAIGFTFDFIGHLQSRKTEQVLPLVRLIHSVESESVLRQIERHAGGRAGCSWRSTSPASSRSTASRRRRPTASSSGRPAMRRSRSGG